MRTAPGTGKVALDGLQIGFLSATGSPAHKGARALLLKREDRTGKRHSFTKDAGAVAADLRDGDDALWSAYEATAEPFLKFDCEDRTPVVMTSSEEGHAHLIWLHRRAGESSWTKSTDAESGHDHPWMVTTSEDGSLSIEIGESEGHTHTVDSAVLNGAVAVAALGKHLKEDRDVSKPTTKTDESASARIESLEKNLALATALLGMPASHRKHLISLDGEPVAQSNFLQKNEQERQAEIDRIETEKNASDPIVYTTKAGVEVRKSDGATVLALAKQADAASDENAVLKAESAELRKVNARARLEKRATEDLGHLPGTIDERVAVVEALEKIEDETVREAAFKAVKAGDAAMLAAFQTGGSSTPAPEGTPQGDLDSLAKKYQEANPGTSIEKATSEVLKTPEGKAAYAAGREMSKSYTQ